MHSSNGELLLLEFQRAILDCKELYLSSGQMVVQQYPNLVGGTSREFIQSMNELHQGLLIKLYVTVADADLQLTTRERSLASTLIQHVWQKQLTDDQLKDTLVHLSAHAAKLHWYSLLRPFDRIAPLREKIATLETVIMRIANIVAKTDGEPTVNELKALRMIQQEINAHLRPIQIDELQHDAKSQMGTLAVKALKEQSTETVGQPTEDTDKDAKEVPKESLEDLLAELDQMIGLEEVKEEVGTLINFLDMQRHRQKMGLPTTEMSLHMVFGGNPGTGKTTVARLIGRIYGAMGVLKKGHLVETDRSGLVAEYAGQTGPKTNKIIDDALDGLLFIDEAYSLVGESGEDNFGQEALQTLLKRMEDDRERLVVILAGYPAEMDRLLSSNPGLSSRFNHHLQFEDFTPGQLGEIYRLFCKQNHYVLPPQTMSKLLIGFNWLYQQRDEHFGNGRLVRNTFERAIRELANRIAGIKVIDKMLLSRFEPDDIEFPLVPDGVWDEIQLLEQVFRVVCPECNSDGRIQAKHFGRTIKCRSCQSKFRATSGEPVKSPGS